MAGEHTQKGQGKSNGSKSVMCEVRLDFKAEGKNRGWQEEKWERKQRRKEGNSDSFLTAADCLISLN